MLTLYFFKTYFRILYLSIVTFGLGKEFIYFMTWLPLKFVCINITMFLDNLFFPAYRKTEIRKPVFIIGHPRSGTTFLHRLLTNGGEFSVFKSWEISYPSLTLRHLMRRKMNAVRGKHIHEAGSAELGHERGPDSIEEDEFLFCHILDTQLITISTPIGFAEKGYDELCFNDEQPHRRGSVRFLQGCFKRQIYYTGKSQIIAKMNYSLFRIKTLLEYFPDAKIIYMDRSPLKTIPSHFTLQYSLLQHHFDLNRVSTHKLERFFKNRYNYNLLYYKQFKKLMSSNAISEDQIMVIPYTSLRGDLGGTIEKIKGFTKIKFSEEFENRIKNQIQRQSSYQRKHSVFPLNYFFLTESNILHDFDFVSARYNFDDNNDRD